MTVRFVKTSLVALALVPFLALAGYWENKNVAKLQSTYAGGNCFYFTLEGVTQADPVVPSNPWFTIPRTQYGAGDAYSMLLAARIAGVPVTVHTNGTTACGYAVATEVRMD